MPKTAKPLMLRGMNRRTGFTVVELIITIVIMGILLTLAVVNMQRSQANARDDDRKVDVENIVREFESYYRSPSSTTPASGGSYIGTSYITDQKLRELVPELDARSLRAPQTDAISLVPATNANTTDAGVMPRPSASTYVYQPLSSDGTLCVDHLTGGECRRFTIFYRLENEYNYADDRYPVHKVTSKNQ